MQLDPQQAQRRSAFLLQAVQAASNSPTLTELLGRIEAVMVAAVSAQGGSIYLLDVARGLLLPRPPSAPPAPLPAGHLDLLTHPETAPLIATLLEGHTPVAMAPTGARQHGETCHARGVTSLLGVPLMVGERLLGVALLYTLDPSHHFIAEEIELAEGIAHVVALMIEQALRAEAAEQQLVASQRLRHITLMLQPLRELSELVALVVSEARRLTGALGCAILLLEDPGWLRVVLRVGPSTPTADHIVVEGTFTGEVLRRGELLLTNDPTNEFPLYDGADRASALLAVPLQGAGGVIGTLNLLDKPGGFTRDDGQIISLLAAQAAIAIENARLHQRAVDLATLEERRRIARELHDSVTQVLYSITLSGEAAVRLLAAGQHETGGGHVRRIRDAAHEALQEIRMLLLELHPPVLEQEGLAAALQAQLELLEGRTGVRTELEVEGEERLPLRIKETIYRIAQEILNNVLKHARAGWVTARLHFDVQRVCLEIHDDGAGFERATILGGGGLGLRGMEERTALVAGTMTIASAPGQGTTVRLEVPIP